MEISCRKKTSRKDYEIFGDISYETPEKTSHKTVFDLYLPRARGGADLTSRQPQPVAVFVHGGGWRRGDKDTWRHFVFQDVNFLAAFFYWCYGLYGNVGKEFARRGIPCIVTSYPLTKLKTPWLLLEMATSYFGSVIFCGILLFMIFISVFVIDFLTAVIFITVFPGQRFSITLSDFLNVYFVFVNLVILFVISIQKSKHELQTHYVIALWVVLLGHLFAVILLEHSLLSLWMSSFLIVQGTLLHLNLRSEDYKHDDQLTALSKCIKKVRDIGQETRYFDYNSLFLIGHSAGGHLCSLIALRPDVLASAGVESTCIKGVVAISAVLQVEKLNTPALRPLYLHPTFGKNPDDWSSACPMSRLQNKDFSDLPNFLVITAEKDWHLHHEAAMFAEELEGRDVHQGSVVFPRTTHLSIICNFDRECEVLNTSVANQCVQFILQTYDAEQTSQTCALQRNRGMSCNYPHF